MKDTREEMIKSMAYLLQRNGYAGTSINDIIQHSKSPRGSLYYHFPKGKEQLAIEAIKQTKRNVTTFIKENLSKYDDASESIKYFILDSARRFEENNYFQGVPITALVLETASTSDALREACLEVFEAWNKEFTNKLLLNGYSESDAKILGETINLMIQGGLVMSLARKNADALKAVSTNASLLIKADFYHKNM